MEPTQNTTPGSDTVNVKVVNLDAPAKFGLNQIGKTTPPLANWIFRGVFYAANITIFIITDPGLVHMSNDLVIRIIHWISAGATIVHPITKLFGLDTKKIEMEAKEAFNLTSK